MITANEKYEAQWTAAKILIIKCLGQSQNLFAELPELCQMTDSNHF